jgi:hypothetical protein
MDRTLRRGACKRRGRLYVSMGPRLRGDDVGYCDGMFLSPNFGQLVATRADACVTHAR